MKIPLVYESDNSRDSLYEEHGATLKHKCGKRIVTLPLLSFLSFFIGPSLIFLASFFRPESHPDLWGNHSLHHPFLTWDNALIMKIITLLFRRSVYYDTHHHCHIALHDHVVDIVFVEKPPFIILSYMSLMSHCTSRYTAGGIHIESYFVLSIEL